VEGHSIVDPQVMDLSRHPVLQMDHWRNHGSPWHDADSQLGCLVPRPVLYPSPYAMGAINLMQFGLLYLYPANNVRLTLYLDSGRGRNVGHLALPASTPASSPPLFHFAVAHSLEWHTPPTLTIPPRRAPRRSF
jgi:hypothetical protein